MSVVIRRVLADEWERVRDLRLEAVRDPDASIAFLHSYDEESARADEFWRQRASGAAAGDEIAQFVAVAGDEWVGTLSVLRRDADVSGGDDGRRLGPHGYVVGVYIRPDHRGAGVADALFTAAARWAGSLGDRALMLHVHVDNRRAQSAYRRVGFVDTGERITGSIGAEMEMARPLASNDAFVVNGMVQK